MSNYIDKIKKDGVIYNIRSIGAYLVEQEPVVAPSGISGNLDYEPDEEKGFQVLDTTYSAGQINTITYNGKVCHLLFNNNGVGYYMSAFEPAMISAPEQDPGELLLSEGGKKGESTQRSFPVKNTKFGGDEFEGAQAILIYFIGGRFITHYIVNAVPDSNYIWIDRFGAFGELPEVKYSDYLDWLNNNIGAYLDRKWDAWYEENGGNNGGGKEDVPPGRSATRGIVPFEIDETFVPTLDDIILHKANYECASLSDLLYEMDYDNDSNYCILITGLMPLCREEESGGGESEE